jgi:nucleotide-binding universal stress UspA family protein
MLSLKTVLFPTDFSAAADQALHVALTLARDHGAKVVLLSVPPPIPPVEGYVPDQDVEQLSREAAERLQVLADGISSVPVETRVMVGAPGAAIVAAAKEYQADLIVMGTHGRTGLTRLLLGSVAEHVLRHAACPVLTVKPVLQSSP